MNREIKFRAYDTYTKIMLPMVDIIKFTKEEGINIIRDSSYGVGVCMPYQPHIELMQYTGLKDKNGVEIYEGDIIGHTDWEEKMRVDGVVKYGEFNCSCCEGVYGWYIDGGDIRKIKSCEVIGNVFENGELLKESEE